MIGRGALALIVGLLVMGGLAVLVEAQSPSSIYWDGRRVAATSQGGIIYYSYRGTPYTITDDARPASATSPVPMAVYLRPDDPGDARADSWVRWLDAACVAVWFAAAVAVVPVAAVRRRRRLQRQAEFAAGDRARSA